MKKSYYIFLTFILILFFSCSSDNTNSTTIEQLLVQGSPWEFSSYEPLGAITLGSPVTVTNEINTFYSNHTLFFGIDGFGISVFSNSEETEDFFQWEVLDSGSLILTFDNLTFQDASPQIVIDNISVSKSQLTILLESDLYEGTSNSEIFHKGNFSYE